MGMRRDSCSSEAKNFALRASLLMARQSPVSKDAGFLHAIIERDSLAHGNAQGFVFKRSEELCPEDKKWSVHLVFRYARSILSRSVYCFKLRYLILLFKTFHYAKLYIRLLLPSEMFDCFLRRIISNVTFGYSDQTLQFILI